jgi:predicted transcriptional regulator of viral defense system
MIPVDVISQYKKFITIDELRNMGYSYYMTDKLVKAGMLSRMNRTTYENLAYKGDENDFFSAEAFVPGGVVCLMSAARYYELTDYLEDGVDVAIQRKKRVSTLPQWPNLKIYYFDSQRMESGVTEIRDGDNSFHIFDIEKTVVDIISYRNRIGIEETAGVLRNYLKRRDRQIDKLYAYAKLLRSEKILRTYCEVLL